MVVKMSRSEDNYRTELIQKINARIPKPYRAYNSMDVKFETDDPKAKKIGKRREFDVVILEEDFVSDRKINPTRVEIAVETKKLGSKESDQSAGRCFVAFPNVHMRNEFRNNLYHRTRFAREIINAEIGDNGLRRSPIDRKTVKRIINDKKMPTTNAKKH